MTTSFPAKVDESVAVAATPAPQTRSVGRLRRVPVADVLGLLASCVIVLIAFVPIVFGGRMLSAAGKGAAGTNGTSAFPGQPVADDSADFRPDPGVSTWALEPWAEVNERVYADGELPLWNPYQGAGTPLAANMQSAAFDPLLLAVNLHPTPRTWDYSMIGAFVLGAAASYVFGRVLGLLPVPSVVTSAAFSLSGFFFLYSNSSFSRSYIYLPVLFALVELVLRSRRLWPVFALGVAVAGNVYVGMPEASFFVIGAGALYAVVRLLQQRREMPWRLSLARLGGGGLLGVLLAAPLLLLFQQYESLSFNAHQSGASSATQADPLWGLVNWIVPFFHGIRGPYQAPGVRNWFGVAVVLAAVIALSGRRETKRLHAWVFFGLGAVVLVKLYDFGILDWVGRLPVANRVNFLAWGGTGRRVSFAVLAGVGVQVLWSRDLDVRRFLILLGSMVGLWVILMVTGDRWSLITQPSAHYLRSVWGRVALFGLLVIVAALVLARFNGRWAALLVAAVIIAELFTLAPFSIYERRADPFATPGWMPYVTAVQRSEPDARVFGIDAKLFPNTAGAFGLQDVRMLDALYVDRYLRYVKTFIQPSATDRFVGGPYASSETEIAHYQNNPMFNALAVRTILSQQDLAAVPALRLVGQDLDTRVYENTAGYPRAWVVHQAHVVGDEDQAFDYLRAHGRRDQDGAVIVDDFDPRREAVVEASGTDRALTSLRGSGDCDGSDDQVSVQGYSAETVTLNVDAACAGLLVLPDTYFPGWTATVNGHDQEIYATDGAFRSVTVPKGSSVVEFHYQPRRFTLGIVLALVGLIGFAAIAAFATWRRRQNARTDSTPNGPEPASKVPVAGSAAP